MHRLLCLTLLLLVTPFSADGSAPEPQAGLYRVTAGISGDDLPPGVANATVEQCVTEEELAADPSSILGEHAGMEGCTITSYDWGNGKISMQMQCAVEGAEATGESKGSYNANGYELITTMRISVGDATVEMESFVRGERIGDC
ncbi:MAG: DUF3617 family protein [Woeseiaceae bacterium]|nr:DUF3617 family protein [Woeseiaceae bacterium]